MRPHKCRCPCGATLGSRAVIVPAGPATADLLAPNRYRFCRPASSIHAVHLPGAVLSRYSFLLGYMFAVYCQSGMDSAVHVSEETVTADRGAAKNLMFSFWANSIYGFAFVLSILFSMQVAHPRPKLSPTLLYRVLPASSPSHSLG